MSKFTAKHLALILIVWMGSAWMMFSAAGIAAERPPAGVTTVEYHAHDSGAAGSLPGRQGHHEIIFDERDDTDPDDAALASPGDPPCFSRARRWPHKSVSVSECVRPWRAVFFLEPRFLRYSRLLN